MGGFWEPKGLKKTIKILNAFWDAKKGAERTGVPLGGMRGPAGEIQRGSGRDLDRELPSSRRIWAANLARHPRWGGGSLRAFRRAGVRDLE